MTAWELRQGDTYSPALTSWVMTKDDLKAMFANLERAPEIVFDLETTGLNEHAEHGGPVNGGVGARVVMMTLTVQPWEDAQVEPTTYVVPLSHPDSPFGGQWRRVFRAIAQRLRGKRLVGHNVKFDSRWVYACTSTPGVAEGKPIYDELDADLFKKGHVTGGYWRTYLGQRDGKNTYEFAHNRIAERALGPCPDGYSVDHLNRDRLDNRRENLRYATRSEQMQNRASWGESGIRGAYRRPNGTYEAAVRVDGKRHYLGVFPTVEEAGDAVRAFQTREGAKAPASLRAKPGIDLSPWLDWDTMISAALLDENESSRLKAVAPRLFGIEPWDDVDLKYPGAAEDVPFFDLGDYAARDTYWTFRVYAAHRYIMWLDGHEDEDPFLTGDDEDIQNARLGQLAETVGMPTVSTLAAVEQRGIGLDVEYTRQALEEARGESERIRQGIAHRYADVEGLDPADVSLAATSKWFLRFTEEAVSRGDLRVISMTGSGRPQWNKATLEKLERQGSELAGDLLRQRDMEKRSQFLSSWLEKATTEGRIHATYNVGRVVTGRLSSSEPNLQQVSAKLKGSYVPSKGYYLAEIDYSQIELRVAAMVSECVPMIEAFQRGDDLHRLLGQRILQGEETRAAEREKREARLISLEDVTPADRQKAKSANFGLLYGMGPEGFQRYAETAYGVEMSLNEAHEVHQTFFDMWVGLTDWHDRQMQFAGRYGYVESPIGRVRRLPNVWSRRPDLSSEAERQAINSPVQGLGSDIMQCAAASIEGRLAGHKPVAGARLVGTVHDSVVIEVQASRWEEVVEECLDRMTEGVVPVLERLGMKFTVPLGAEAAVGVRWGDKSLGVIERG